MAHLNTAFYDNADTYTDGDIENDILALAKDGFDITDSAQKYPYAVAYHFSPERENILSWYPFKKGAVCLEIGAGCGAVTGMLCKKCARVVSVDISKRRCEINLARHKDCDDLEIICGNIQKINFDQQFDYVILNGVFEYALSFIHTKTPYLSLMQLAKSFLKPDGRLFIAIENRLGLKYLNGAAEDHTDANFLGINGYEGNDSVRTFSKQELITLIKESGFKNHRFYYPYPDYKFPNEIFTDSTVNNGSYGAPYMNMNTHSFGLYSEQKAAAALAAEGIADRFSNSFLIEISDAECDYTIDYVKINSLRRPEYGIMTVLVGGMRYACKLPLTPAANAHITHMHESEDIYPAGINALKAEPYGSGLKYPFINAKSLTNAILESTDEKPVSTALKAFFDKFSPEAKDYHDKKFGEIFGDKTFDGSLECICPANIDLICDNIFMTDGNYTVIDNEWVQDTCIPLKFIIWRCINELYYKNPQLEQKEPLAEVMSAFDMTDRMCDVFTHWAVHFADNYVGNNYLAKYAVPLNQVSLMALYDERQAERVFSTSCYYDRGSGFSEDDKAFALIELADDGNFDIEFPLYDDITAFRWDPAEGLALKCRIESVSSGELVPNNASGSEDGYDVFLTADPSYTLKNFGKDKIRITGNIRHIDKSELFARLEKNAAAYTAQLNKQQTVYEAMLTEKDEIIADKNAKLDESALAADLSRHYIKSCEDRMGEYFDTIVALNHAVEDYQQQVRQCDARYQQIINSHGYKFMSIFWRLRAKFKK